MATTGRQRVQAAISATEQVIASVRSAARRAERLESDLAANAEGVLTDPQDIAKYCDTVAADLAKASEMIRATTWPLDNDYYDDNQNLRADIPA